MSFENTVQFDQITFFKPLVPSFASEISFIEILRSTLPLCTVRLHFWQQHQTLEHVDRWSRSPVLLFLMSQKPLILDWRIWNIKFGSVVKFRNCTSIMTFSFFGKKIQMLVVSIFLWLERNSCQMPPVGQPSGGSYGSVCALKFYCCVSPGTIFGLPIYLPRSCDCCWKSSFWHRLKISKE